MSGKRIVELTIPAASPSPNSWVRAGHWGKYQSIKTRFLKLVYEATLEHYPRWKFGAPMSQASIDVIRHGARILDRDNAYGGLKPIIDALVKNGLIVDDRTENVVSLTVEQVKCKRIDERTDITITEL